MKPPPFSYHVPHSVEEAVGLLATLENARVLAGGQSLMPMLNMRFVTPDHVIDINRIADLAGIEVEDQMIRIGAMTRQRDLEFSPLIAERLPLMAEALTLVGHRQTRNRGTIGGSLCHLDPAAELPCVATAHDALIEIVGAGSTRVVPFSEFPLGYLTPALDSGEMVRSIRIAPWASESGSAFVEFARRHGDFAIVSAAVLLQLDADERITRLSMALGGVGTAPMRLGQVEDELTGARLDDRSRQIVSDACQSLEIEDDPYTPASYRRHLCIVQAMNALELARSRALSRMSGQREAGANVGR